MDSLRKEHVALEAEGRTLVHAFKPERNEMIAFLRAKHNVDNFQKSRDNTMTNHSKSRPLRSRFIHLFIGGLGVGKPPTSGDMRAYPPACHFLHHA
ncbi:MAG: hypothetical protein FWH42_05735 [Dehalococcoidia bacterium]|nr:hypothetical protein [Dehalococcoidia bacterium]